jgi:hypothetical protein
VDKTVHILVNWLRIVIHQLFCAPGVATWVCQLAVKFAAVTGTYPNML